METRGLSELLDVWPENAPQTLEKLRQLPYEDIDEFDFDSQTKDLLRELRRHAIEVNQAAGREQPLNSPTVLFELLRKPNSIIRPKAGKWLVYPLDENRQRILTPRGDGDYAWSKGLYPRFPWASELPRTPKRGCYLVLYGGGPKILLEDDVPPKILTLLDEAPVADVLFWELNPGRSYALHSLRAGASLRDGREAEFPHLDRFDPPVARTQFASAAGNTKG